MYKMTNPIDPHSSMGMVLHDLAAYHEEPQSFSKTHVNNTLHEIDMLISRNNQMLKRIKELEVREQERQFMIYVIGFAVNNLDKPLTKQLLQECLRIVCQTT